MSNLPDDYASSPLGTLATCYTHQLADSAWPSARSDDTALMLVASTFSTGRIFVGGLHTHSSSTRQASVDLGHLMTLLPGQGKLLVFTASRAVSQRRR